MTSNRHKFVLNFFSIEIVDVYEGMVMISRVESDLEGYELHLVFL